MLKKYTLILFITLIVWSCKKENKPAVTPPLTVIDTATFTSVILKAGKNPGKLTDDIICTVTGDEITALIPSIENDKKLIVTFTLKTEGSVVKVKDTTIVSGTTTTDFTKPVTYTVTTPKGVTKTYKFSVKNFTGIPIFYLTTSSPIVSKDDYVTGTLLINTNTEYEQVRNNIALQARGRGNATWGLKKKPYRLKFNSKAAVLDLPAAKNWVLLANHFDETLIRTSTAFELGDILGAHFTPKGRFVELVLNGEYKGTYLLTNQVEVHENRVNIPELKTGDVSADKITGGYLLELDYRLDEEFWFKTTRNVPFCIKSPEDIPQAQFNYIKSYIQQTEDAIFAPDFADPVNGYAKYIDVESFISWYLVEELAKNFDAKNVSSIFYYKDRGGKLCMGPLWDFDIGFGTVDMPPQGWWVKDGTWFSRLFQDPAFAAKVKARWKVLSAKEIYELENRMDSTLKYINLAQKQNFVRWDVLNKPSIPGWPITDHGDYNGEVEHLDEWIERRIAWMDAEMNKY